MTGVSPLELFLFIGIVSVSTLVGWLVSSVVPWRFAAWRVGLPWAVAISLAPFIVGLLSIILLALLPGNAAVYQLLLMIALLFMVTVLFRRRIRHLFLRVRKRRKKTILVPLLSMLLGAWILLLFINSILFPLTQNDSLEYALAARDVYVESSLQNYPPLDPENSQSGFFGPWSHPPLYVALIATSFAIQGNSEQPGLSRLLAPWFLLGCIFVVAALGRLHSRPVGLLAAILVISAPVLFLGASSSLIDALPVAGVALLMSAVVGIRATGWRYGIWMGGALGLLLWTHSQALLFVPIGVGMVVAWRGLRQWKRLVSETGAMLLTAALVGGEPYLQNFRTFGAIITDDPAVFALESLDWRGYFDLARGLGDWFAVVQYGLFKGLSSINFYGILFWLVLMGLFLLYRRHGRAFRCWAGTGIAGVETTLQPMLMATVVLAIYYLGLLASVALGLNIMIRNDRYLAVMVPSAALVAAYGVWILLQRCLPARWSPEGGRTRRYVIIASIICVGMVAYEAMAVYVIGWHYRFRNIDPHVIGDAFPGSVSWMQRNLDYFPAFRVIREIDDRVPDDGLVLALRPSNMYYAHRRMISYLDPRLLPFYKAKDVDTAWRELQSLGVGYLQVSDYYLPVMYNSFLQEILADPRRAALLYSSGGDQLYALRDSGLMRTDYRDISPRVMAWHRGVELHIPRATAFTRVFDVGGTLPSDGFSASGLPLFQRGYGVLLSTGSGRGLDPMDGGGEQLVVEPGSEYLVRIRLRGKGFIRFSMMEYSGKDKRISYGNILDKRTILLGNLSLTERYPERTFIRRIRVHPDSQYIRIGIEHVGLSSVRIESAELIRLSRPAGKKHRKDPVPINSSGDIGAGNRGWVAASEGRDTPQMQEVLGTDVL